MVIRGFNQRHGIDYLDTYAPVAAIATIRVLIALDAIQKLVIHQMDVKTVFLNGELEEKVYMKQPEDFAIPGQEKEVCKLIRSLYGLKQPPKQWHQKFDEVVLSFVMYLAKLNSPNTLKGTAAARSKGKKRTVVRGNECLLYTSPSPRD